MLVNCNEILKKMIAEHNLNLHSVVILITALADRFCWLSLAIVYLKMVCCFFLEYVADEVLTYEEVALLRPDPQRKRPVVLIGMKKPLTIKLLLHFES